jgi:dipeptidase D
MKNKELIDEFLRISSFPRPSGGEAALRNYLIENARQMGFDWQQDEAGNLAIFVPPTPGMENLPGIILQAHMDMVYVAEGEAQRTSSPKPIRVIEKDSWLLSDGTSLGADNGIGCAMALCAVRDREIHHGPLSLLFTVEEEVGMRGMNALSTDLIDDRALYAVNLDFESENHICIGCAGGLVVNAGAKLPTETCTTEGSSIWHMRAQGVHGGHSGLEIDGRPLNLHQHLFHLLAELGACLVSYDGGDATNSIPTWAEIVFAASKEEDKRIIDTLNKQAESFSSIHSHPGGNPVLEFEHIADERASGCLSRSETFRLARILTSLPNGVLARHPELGGSLQSSSNLGYVRLSANGNLQIGLATRSDDDNEAASLKDKVLATLQQLPDATLKLDEFPAWHPESESALVRHIQDCRKGIFPSLAELVSVHAGIECGQLVSKRPGLRAVSIGPDITAVHTTKERASIDSLGRVYEWLKIILNHAGKLDSQWEEYKK